MFGTLSYFEIFLVLVHVNLLGNPTPKAYWSKSYISILVQPKCRIPVHNQDDRLQLICDGRHGVLIFREPNQRLYLKRNSTGVTRSKR
jgi:hypothetical protein